MIQCLWCSFARGCWNSLANLTSYFWLPVCICIFESNLFDPESWTVDINWYIYIALIKIIESIYNPFSMPMFTYTSINYNGVKLWHKRQKVQCRCTYVLFGTTIIVIPYCTQWCCQWFLSLRNEIKSLLCAVVLALYCLLLSDKKSEILYDVDVMV